jgi:hypothetical protein
MTKIAGVDLMPEEAKHPEPEQEDSVVESSIPEGRKAWQFLKGKWFLQSVVILVVLSVVFQAGGWIYYYTNTSGGTAQSLEIGLGQYEFKTIPPVRGRIAQAQFSLHVTLLKDLEKTGRKALENHKYRVQQDVEQLLRQVHGGDFEEPDLGGLKLQIREKIDKAVGSRVVSDVIITDLKLIPASPPEHPVVAENTSIPVGQVPLKSHSQAN